MVDKRSADKKRNAIDFVLAVVLAVAIGLLVSGIFRYIGFLGGYSTEITALVAGFVGVAALQILKKRA